MVIALLALTLFDLALVLFSLARFPEAGWSHALPVTLLLALAAAAIAWAWLRLAPETRAWALRFGVAAGVVLGGEVLLEYALLPKDNSTYGLVEYGLFLALLLAAGVLCYRDARSLVASLLAGAWTGILATLIWYAVVLLVFHLFWVSPQQAQVFQAEGNLQDFARSGMSDFTAFIVQDFFGAGFFHLLLGGLIGALLGGLGGLAAKLLDLLGVWG